LGEATAFFSEIGFAFDPQFTGETATRMIIRDVADDEQQPGHRGLAVA
jgi:predicted lactoylglutathione lyase